MDAKTLSVEVVYAESHKQVLIHLSVPNGATVLDAINASTILVQFPKLAETDFLIDRVGIFGKSVSLSTRLKAGDRVEIYRDLIKDPMTQRRLKARDLKRKKAQAFDEKKRQKKVERKKKTVFKNA